MALDSLDHKRPGYQAKKVRVGSGALQRMRGRIGAYDPGSTAPPPAFWPPLYGPGGLGPSARLSERILQPGLTN